MSVQNLPPLCLNCATADEAVALFLGAYRVRAVAASRSVRSCLSYVTSTSKSLEELGQLGGVVIEERVAQV